jgi:hypothetical protein
MRRAGSAAAEAGHNVETASARDHRGREPSTTTVRPQSAFRALAATLVIAGAGIDTTGGLFPYLQ